MNRFLLTKPSTKRTWTKRVTSWTEYNPQSKWDWYSLGGRWADSLLLKTNDRHKGKKGHPSWTKGDDWKPEAGRADQARFGAIDWEGMVKEKDMEAIGKEWDDNLAGPMIFTSQNIILKNTKQKEEYIREGMCFLHPCGTDSRWCLA